MNRNEALRLLGLSADRSRETMSTTSTRLSWPMKGNLEKTTSIRRRRGAQAVSVVNEGLTAGRM